MIKIIAGSRRRAFQYATKNRIKNWSYVFSIHDLQWANPFDVRDVQPVFLPEDTYFDTERKRKVMKLWEAMNE